MAQNLDQFHFDGRVIRASYGTTKFCSFFLRNKPCVNKNCLYLHQLGQKSEILQKAEIAEKTFCANQELRALKLSKAIERSEKAFKTDYEKYAPKDKESRFPAPEALYHKEFSVLGGKTLIVYQAARTQRGRKQVKKEEVERRVKTTEHTPSVEEGLERLLQQEWETPPQRKDGGDRGLSGEKEALGQKGVESAYMEKAGPLLLLNTEIWSGRARRGAAEEADKRVLSEVISRSLS